MDKSDASRRVVEEIEERINAGMAPSHDATSTARRNDMKSSSERSMSKKRRVAASMPQDPRDATASIQCSTQQRKRTCIPRFSSTSTETGQSYKEQYQHYLNSLREQTLEDNGVCPDFSQASAAGATSSNVEDLRTSKQKSHGFLSNEQQRAALLDILFEEENCETQQSVPAYGGDISTECCQMDGDDVKDFIKNASVHSHDSIPMLYL